jgi:hypothetical protein
MLFLKGTDSGEFILTEEYHDNATIPQYAILSHTWGKDQDEVTFKTSNRLLPGTRLGIRRSSSVGNKLQEMVYF